ncbi:MAG: aldo/keto reductase [Clostridia bacterium]|nr:aldo/keto reductase [Clostridia bacterium]
MIFNNVKDDTLSLLGFGAMRLPTTNDGKIDETAVREMVKIAMDNGVNYFDTAYPYHNGESELVMGRVLKDYPRESYRLATKYPGHQIVKEYNPKAVFEDQLKKCGVEYFDYYLLHNVYENSYGVYTDERWGILDYFREQKRLGRIKHLGFSTHGGIEVIKKFLDYCEGDMEFCQIQLNYLDWTLQNAKAKCELLAEYDVPVWVMEPVRGGKLANLGEKDANTLKSLRNDESIASWCFRFLHTIPNVKMILSGMSNLEQMQDNIKTFKYVKPLTSDEINTLLEIAEGMKDSIPCTACGYCKDGCPQEINIPQMIEILNEMRVAPVTNASMRIEFLPESQKPSACINCGNCVHICPQNIDIPTHLKSLAEYVKNLPSWAEISRQREEIANKMKNT